MFWVVGSFLGSLGKGGFIWMGVGVDEGSGVFLGGDLDLFSFFFSFFSSFFGVFFSFVFPRVESMFF